MKLNNDFRAKAAVADLHDDQIKKAVKLAPIKKNGKERANIYDAMEDDDLDMELLRLKKTESVLDYFDDGDDEQSDDYDEDQDEEEFDDDDLSEDKED